MSAELSEEAGILNASIRGFALSVPHNRGKPAEPLHSSIGQGWVGGIPVPDRVSFRKKHAQMQKNRLLDVVRSLILRRLFQNVGCAEARLESLAW